MKNFLNCSKIKEIIFEHGLKTIGKNAFAQTGIKKIVLPESITEIHAGAFGNCQELENVELKEGVISIGDLAFGGQSKLTEIIIPKSVTTINERAFSGCKTLKSVKFKGDAPKEYINANPQITAVNVDYTIYYHTDAKGFSSPEWNGYKTKIW